MLDELYPKTTGIDSPCKKTVDGMVIARHSEYGVIYNSLATNEGQNVIFSCETINPPAERPELANIAYTAEIDCAGEINYINPLPRNVERIDVTFDKTLVGLFNSEYTTRVYVTDKNGVIKESGTDSVSLYRHSDEDMYLHISCRGRMKGKMSHDHMICKASIREMKFYYKSKKNV